MGTFVAQRHIDRDHNRLVSYLESATKRRLRSQIEVLSCQVVGATLIVARRLKLREDEPVTRVRTLRLADGEPLAIHDEHVPYRLFPT